MAWNNGLAARQVTTALLISSSAPDVALAFQLVFIARAASWLSALSTATAPAGYLLQ